MLNERFTTYFRETFFHDKEEEFQDFLTSIERSIPRTIRIKPGQESVKDRLESDGWILRETNIDRVFSLDRRDDFDPRERRIGFSLDHLLGNFYIQELAAAHPVDILADSRIQTEPFLILDMASSPGGKTTQLCEYFPNSFIIANEPTRERIPQLLQNLERMGTPNVGITLYSGQYWKNHPQTFDRILLDAPCSGEGTLYKGTDAVRHWHIKNIKNIAKLQEKLLDAGLHALKVDGEMIYSTCALNLIENEQVVENLAIKYPGTFEIIFQKKFWPHIDGTGGFFVTKIRKIHSIPTERTGENQTHSNEKLRLHTGSIGKWKQHEGTTLYEHENKILATRNESIIQPLLRDIFVMRFGEYIGNLDKGKLIPHVWAHRYLHTDHLESYILPDEESLDHYLRGHTIEIPGSDSTIRILYNNLLVALEERRNNIISNNFPTDWRRK